MSHQARKRFGQNFLSDASVIASCLSCFNAKVGEHVVEIGPGLGALTRHLVERLDRLEVIELDRDIVPKLKSNCAPFCDAGHVLQVYNEDVLKFDFRQLHEDKRPLRIIGNLPYNISTPLIFRLLADSDMIQDMYFMLQKEVVDRMTAMPGSKQYGRLGVMVQYHCQVDKLFDVAAEAFTPAPRVQSAFVRLQPYAHKPVMATNEKLFAQVVMQAFSLRRKTLRNCLKDMIDDHRLQALGIDPGVRAEQLQIRDFVNISNDLSR